MAEYHRLLEDVRAKRTAVATVKADVKPYEPLDAATGGKKRQLAVELELEETRWLAGEAFNAALAAFTEALGHESDNPDARREIGEFHYFHMVRAEGQGDTKELAFHRKQVELYNDGDLDERLEGHGSLALTTNPLEAEVLLYRYEEEGWFLKTQEERSLGTTPVGKLDLPMGSYLLVLQKEGYLDTRVLERLVEARYARGSEKTKLLRSCNLQVEKLRFLARLSKDLNLLSVRRYEFAVRALDDIGRQIGGWARHRPSSRGG